MLIKWYVLLLSVCESLNLFSLNQRENKQHCLRQALILSSISACE